MSADVADNDVVRTKSVTKIGDDEIGRKRASGRGTPRGGDPVPTRNGARRVERVSAGRARTIEVSATSDSSSSPMTSIDG